MGKSKDTRIVFQNEYHSSTFTAGDSHAFRVDLPSGYRVVSASMSPIEDGNWSNVDLKGYTFASVGTVLLDRVVFYYQHPSTASGNEGVHWQVVAERSDEPDTFSTVDAVEIF